MSEKETKHVQTELDAKEYDRLQEVARERGLSIKEAGHEALIEWIQRQQQVDPLDPAFTVLEDLDDESLPASATTDAREEADLVEEWHGSDESFTLADDPPTES